MNKRALEEYALFARKELESQITLSLNKLGIYEDRVLKANIVGDFTVVEGSQETFPKRVYTLRESILTNLKLEERKFSSAVEEYAYTWFNRIIAIRFMEVHNYFDHGFKVLTSSDGSYEPEILKNAHYLIDELNLDIDVILSLKEQNKIEELYRYLLFKQCNALNSILPELFDDEASYMELLLPNNLLSQDSIIRRIEDIPEADFTNQVEIVGWLYEFYNSVKKDRVFASGETITKESLPAVTQLFTPDWIVRYMVDNSLGRLWVENNKSTNIKNNLKYYLESLESSNQSEKISDPTKIKIVEPCCGSGHILVYLFDVLYLIYKSCGAEDKDIPSMIFKNNIYGLDVDKRAIQLSQFSLIMKARSIDKQFFRKDRFVKPKVYEIIDSTVLKECDYKENMNALNFSVESIRLVDRLVDIFSDAKTIGSLLKVKNYDFSSLVDDIKRCQKNETPNFFEQNFYYLGLKNLKNIIRVAKILSRKHDIMVTNPPYIGISTMEVPVKKYADLYYPLSKTDMYAMFMETDLVKDNGYLAMINMHGWMFIDSFVDFRRQLFKHYTIESLLHLGIKAFELIGNDVVQTCSFVMRKKESSNTKSTFVRLVDVKDYSAKQVQFFNKDLYFYPNCTIFTEAPSVPFAYWVDEQFFLNYKKGKKLSDFGVLTGTKNVTGNNEKFLRQFWEVDYHNINKDYWVPYSKGGFFRKYYGNVTYVADWRKDALEFYQKNKTSSLLDKELWYKKGITYSSVTSRGTAFRYFPEGYMCDGAGPVINIEEEHINNFMGFLNSKVAEYYLSVVNPTINLTKKDLQTLPYIMPNDDRVSCIVNNQIEMAKYDWKRFETTFEFEQDELVRISKEHSLNKISDCFEKYYSIVESQNKHFELNERKITKIFSELYSLDNDKFVFEERDFNYIHLSKESTIKSLVSYLVGCILGRYSLEKAGIVFAGGYFNKTNYGSYVDDDGIIPIYQFVGIEDGLTKGVCGLIKKIFGDTYYRDNLDYIADVLDRKVNEGAEEAINRYLNENFYDDHVKLYQKRPIYWMLSSGKQGAFKCLVYIHRYTKNTLAAVNSKYFLPRTAMYKAERERLEFKLRTADVRDKKKVEQELQRVEACEQELLEYGQVLDHVANQCLNEKITIDLDDGVKVNYVKFQNISLEVNGATIKKNLLVPFGLESEKKKK